MFGFLSSSLSLSITSTESRLSNLIGIPGTSPLVPGCDDSTWLAYPLLLGTTVIVLLTLVLAIDVLLSLVCIFVASL